MRIRVLGSGASDGWPNPWCGCGSCTAAREQGVHRNQTSVLLDDTVLVDVGPTTGAHGTDLSRVRLALVTHRHLDHHFSQAWVWRSWAVAPGPLTLLAPASVLEQAEAVLGPEVSATAVRPGEEHEAHGYRVRVLDAEHADDSVLYDVTGPDGGRLFYGTDTGVLPQSTVDAVRDRDFDVVLLELSGAPMPSHLTLANWPQQVERLRAVGAVSDRTRVRAIHVGHHNPPPDELDRRLRALGAAAVRDGEVLDTVRPGRRVLVLGGQSSGKSEYAEALIDGDVTYVATAPSRTDDPEWLRKVERHVTRRPASWRTVETGDVAAVLREPGGPVLVDDLGLWLTRVLEEHWESPHAREVFDAALAELVSAWAESPRDVVLVAPEVGSGVVPATRSGRLFADLLGQATTALAHEADEVVQVVAGRARSLS